MTLDMKGDWVYIVVVRVEQYVGLRWAITIGSESRSRPVGKRSIPVLAVTSKNNIEGDFIYAKKHTRKE